MLGCSSSLILYLGSIIKERAGAVKRRPSSSVILVILVLLVCFFAKSRSRCNYWAEPYFFFVVA